LKIVLIVTVLVAMLAAATVLYGRHSWRASTRAMETRLAQGRERVIPATIDFRELERLPAPVQRYFRAVLREGKPMVTGAHVEHSGTFNAGDEVAQWKPFSSTQQVTTKRPGFVWDARIRMAPGITVHVHDAYINGQGVLRAKLLGILTVMDQPATPELAQGELMRFLAEAAWYPTALLPSQGVRWEAVSDTRASATLQDSRTEVSLIFEFDAQGLIASVYSDARYRLVKGAQVQTPWQGRFWNYQDRGGMLVPLSGEVAWLLPEGQKPYWRGHIDNVKHAFAE
jgi:hypothetical protein